VSIEGLLTLLGNNLMTQLLFLINLQQVIKTEDVNAAPPPSLSGSSQEKFQKEDTIVDKIAPPLFSKPVPEEVGISEPLFARMSSLSAQELEKEKDAAALAWAGAEKQPAHPRRESIGMGSFDLVFLPSLRATPMATIK
jgi:hypothetical protein